jgi:chromosome segregation ATPase
MKIKNLFESIGELDPKSLDIITTLLEKDIPKQEFEYFKFRMALEAMESIQSDENSQFQSVMATGKVLGATKDGILESLKKYKELVTKDRVDFENEFESRKNLKIEEKNKEINRISDQISQHQLTIENLKIELNEYTNKKIVLTSQLEEEKSKMDSTKDNYLNVANAIENYLKLDEEKIMKYL